MRVLLTDKLGSVFLYNVPDDVIAAARCVRDWMVEHNCVELCGLRDASLPEHGADQAPFVARRFQD
jgi:hypothetical protein